MANTVDIKKLKEIRKNYPSTYEWIKSKASWEHMSIGAVVNNYKEYIDLMMSKEDSI